jgi:putative GTP pyrophosphokinase
MSNVWLEDAMLLHARLTPAVVTILQSVLKANSIDYLTITGRTKDRSGALEKIKRKGYGDPAHQLTDLSGVRVVLFSESDVRNVSDLMSRTFSVDHDNSLNQDDLLKTNQTGYRSVHFVCDLGSARDALPEFSGLAKLRFEIQLRTVLQHAWAELSHDRNYKFGGKLPKDLERRLYLYAGLLEIADKGFDELARSIDEYATSIETKSENGDFGSEVNSITLRQFVRSWADDVKLEIEDRPGSDNYSDLLQELDQFGIKTLEDLKAHAMKARYETNVYGLVRDWMLAHDWRRFDKEVKRDWIIPPTGDVFLESFFDPSEYQQVIDCFGFGSSKALRPKPKRPKRPSIEALSSLKRQT